VMVARLAFATQLAVNQKSEGSFGKMRV